MSATRATNNLRDSEVCAQAVNAEFFRALGHPPAGDGSSARGASAPTANMTPLTFATK
jgi:hypothetical protein